MLKLIRWNERADRAGERSFHGQRSRGCGQ